MSGETDYFSPSELDSVSASEWCESGSDTDCQGQQGPTPPRSNSHKAPSFVSGPLSVQTLPSIPAPSSFPSGAPTPTSVSSSQYQVPNDQAKYPDLPDYMPYMPHCVPHNSPRSAPLNRPIGLTADQMNAFIQQNNGSHQYLSPGSSYSPQELQTAAEYDFKRGKDICRGANLQLQQVEYGLTTGRSQVAGEHDFTAGKNYQGAGMSLQQGIKNEYQPGNDDLLMTCSGMSLCFDRSASAFYPQHCPEPFERDGFNFVHKAPMPFAPSDAELAMEPSEFAPFGAGELTVDSEHNNSKPKGNLNANARTIPLLCFLCEKTPKFSDVSHLLTHISSKGHLSRRFHLDLRAQTDDDVQQRLLQFDLWFEQHGIQQLLKTRQEVKDKKKQTQKRQRGAGNEKKSRRSSSTREGLKSEPEDALQISASHLNPLNQQSWYPSVPFDNSYQTPSNKRSRSVYPEPESPQELSYQNDEPNETGRQGGCRTPTLKGVIHKGMGIFDAGTPEMKRMRNQRKHPSVLNNMVLVSESISMTEQVWNGSMTTLEHERNVYDTPTDLSSPCSKDNDEPLPKKPRTTRAAPKATVPASKRLTRSATRTMNGSSTRASRGGKRAGGKRGGKRGGGKKTSKIEDDVIDSDEELHIGRGKRSLSVFHDTVAGGGPMGDVFGGRSVGAQGFGGSSFGDHQAMISHRTAMQGLPSNRPVSSIYGRPDQFVMYDKENDRNAFPLHQNSNISDYYKPRQNMHSGVFNPLCVQRQDNFPNVFNEGFETFKQTNSALQPVHGIGYSGMHGGMSTGLSHGLNNGMHNDLHNGLNNDFSNGHMSGTNGSQFPRGNNAVQNNDFEIQCDTSRGHS